MPELPEVETTRRGIAPHLAGRRFTGARVRNRRLRRPVPRDLSRLLAGRPVTGVRRRGKYLVIDTPAGSLIIHLGMSGSLRVVPAGTPPGPHDHVDLLLDDGRCLRLRDPRRFGLVLFTRRDPLAHPLLRDLGPEPLAPGFGGDDLWRRARGRRTAIKNFIMDGRVVAGVGNIYANEALFRAGIHPARPAGRIGRARMARLAAALRAVLEEAIAAGGTSLRDFTDSQGEPGYFALSLAVYGREGEPCPRCGRPIRHAVMGQRGTFYCPRCQR